MKLLALLILFPAAALAAEEVYVQPEPPRYEVRVAQVCDREMWVAIYQSAIASRATSAQARARADAIAHGCKGRKL